MSEELNGLKELAGEELQSDASNRPLPVFEKASSVLSPVSYRCIYCR